MSVEYDLSNGKDEYFVRNFYKALDTRTVNIDSALSDIELFNYVRDLSTDLYALSICQSKGLFNKYQPDDNVGYFDNMYTNLALRIANACDYINPNYLGNKFKEHIKFNLERGFSSQYQNLFKDWISDHMDIVTSNTTVIYDETFEKGMEEYMADYSLQSNDDSVNEIFVSNFYDTIASRNIDVDVSQPSRQSIMYLNDLYYDLYNLKLCQRDNLFDKYPPQVDNVSEYFDGMYSHFVKRLDRTYADVDSISYMCEKQGYKDEVKHDLIAGNIDIYLDWVTSHIQAYDEQVKYNIEHPESLAFDDILPMRLDTQTCIRASDIACINYKILKEFGDLQIKNYQDTTLAEIGYNRSRFEDDVTGEVDYWQVNMDFNERMQYDIDVGFDEDYSDDVEAVRVEFEENQAKLFERIYAVDTFFNKHPDISEDIVGRKLDGSLNIPITLSSDTRSELGSEYEQFCYDKLMEYAVFLRDNHKTGSGIDFSLGVADEYIGKAVEKDVEIKNEYDVPYNRQYDNNYDVSDAWSFDEYDNYTGDVDDDFEF